MAAETEDTVEFLATARLGEKGQLTIPKKYRQSLALDPGSPIAVIRVGNALLLIPEQARFRDLCDRVARAFSSRAMTAAEVVSMSPEARESTSGFTPISRSRGAVRRGPRERNADDESRPAPSFLDSNVLTGGILLPTTASTSLPR